MQSSSDRVHVVISAEAARKLDQVVAQVMAQGIRPGGRRACRGTVMEGLIDGSITPQTPSAGESSEGR